MAVISLFGMLFVFAHYEVMSMAMNHPWPQQHGQEPPFDPREFFAAFKWFYLLLGAWSLFSIITNSISGFYIWKKEHWMTSMVVAGFNCVNFPFGTALGVFTMMILMRDSVRARYESPGPAGV